MYEKITTKLKVLLDVISTLNNAEMYEVADRYALGLGCRVNFLSQNHNVPAVYQTQISRRIYGHLNAGQRRCRIANQ